MVEGYQTYYSVIYSVDHRINKIINILHYVYIVRKYEVYLYKLQKQVKKSKYMYMISFLDLFRSNAKNFYFHQECTYV